MMTTCFSESKKPNLHTLLVLGALRTVALLESDPERAKGFEIGSGETDLRFSVIKMYLVI